MKTLRDDKEDNLGNDGSTSLPSTYNVDFDDACKQLKPRQANLLKLICSTEFLDSQWYPLVFRTSELKNLVLAGKSDLSKATYHRYLRLFVSKGFLKQKSKGVYVIKLNKVL